jgi:hypothetical protein
MGGLPAGGIDLDEHPMEPWQKLTRAMRQVLGDEKRMLVRTDELRRAIEDLPPARYDSLPYFDRWIRAVTNILIEKGVVTEAELAARMEELRRKRASA